MTPLDLINHIRRCSLDEVRKRLEWLQTKEPEKYQVVMDFLLSCKVK